MSEHCIIACHRLKFTVNEQLQYEALRTKIFHALIRIEEVTDGYSFTLKQESELLHDLADWLPLEHKCCPFLQITLTLYHGEHLELKMTGPEQVKEFLLQELNLQ